ncbi:MAG: STT3 domain-containing protein [Candidatus Aenigmarchaeota archaeon]|nr:STT3 domain-containing protein [Candidatus Aenigmarchaeota archaeon]MDI6722312.1 STT3 domain-containing protein [Candidatus Aenigmarchaeota archaeon]
MKKTLAISAAVIFISIIINFYYFIPSSYVAKNQGTVLDDNWFEALTWINKNTEECAVIATYWDPGHFITGIARRPVVFDGASQGDKIFSTDNSYNLSPGEIKTGEHDNGIVQITRKIDEPYWIDYISKHYSQYLNGTERARIKDIAISLFTSNESLALKYLKDYRQPGCEEFYYIASSDLIGKSTWWTYFATWSPEGSPKPCTQELNKGSCYSYLNAGLQQARPSPDGSIIYIYPFAAQQSFLIYETNGTKRAFLQQGNKVAGVRNLLYFTQSQGLMTTNENAEVPGLLIQSPDRGNIIFMPPELQNSMFTKLMFFDGAGLEHFRLVNNWGGEVKLYKVTFPEDK